jgi:hypothetical protein
MKTTIEIADPLFTRAKAAAERGHTTLRALVEEGLRRVLADRAGPGTFKLRDASFKGGRGMNPEFVAGGWPKIRDAIYGYDER